MTFRRLISLAFLACIAALAAIFVTEQLSVVQNGGWHLARTLVKVSAPSRSLRPRYPYSIVPGGVFSKAELIRASQKDALVHQHYSDFDAPNAQLVTTTQDEFQYVSYRMNNKVFWTRRKLLIPKGEVLLTDGTNFCRTRCGNRLSSKPHRETTAMEPSEHVLALPNFRPELLSNHQIDIGAPPPLGLLAENIDPLHSGDDRLNPIAPPDTDETILAPLNFPVLTPAFAPNQIVPGPSYVSPPPGGPGTVIPNSPPPVLPSVSAAPEPQSFGLLLLAASIFFAIFLRRRSRAA